MEGVWWWRRCRWWWRQHWWRQLGHSPVAIHWPPMIRRMDAEVRSWVERVARRSAWPVAGGAGGEAWRRARGVSAGPRTALEHELPPRVDQDEDGEEPVPVVGGNTGRELWRHVMGTRRVRLGEQPVRDGPPEVEDVRQRWRELGAHVAEVVVRAVLVQPGGDDAGGGHLRRLRQRQRQLRPRRRARGPLLMSRAALCEEATGASTSRVSRARSGGTMR